MWYEKGDLTAVMAADPEKTIIFDTETTGFDARGKDEILQLSILNGQGNILFSSYIKPEKRRSWPKAQEVNGITPAMVKNAPTIASIYNEIQDIFDAADLIVGYNVEFDLRFIEAVNIKLKEGAVVFDVMKEYAPVNGKYDEYHGDYKWCKLTACARHYGYRFNAHDALEDTKATRHCFYAMLEDEAGYLRVVREYAEYNEQKREAARCLAEAEAPNTSKKRKTWLWVLGWIFILPVPATILMLRKWEVHPVLKYFVIAVIWLLYLDLLYS